MYEQHLRFIVPADSAGAVRSELETVCRQCDEVVLSARYFDTADGQLAAQGVSLRLRREAGQWMQSWSHADSDGITRIEHHLPLAHGALNLAAFVGRRAVDHAIASERDAVQLQQRLRARYQLVFERLRGVLHSHSGNDACAIEIALDAGEIRARSRQEPVLELSFSLLNGELPPLLALAARWQREFGLIYNPLGSAGIGSRIAAREPATGVRAARPIVLPDDCRVNEAARVILDECIAQVAQNAVAICTASANEKHIRQCRRGLRRLLVIDRVLRGQIRPLPGPARRKVKRLIRILGAERRDRQFREALLAQLYAAGCGPLGQPFNTGANQGTTPVGADLQALLMLLLQWRNSVAGGRRAKMRAALLISKRLRKRVRRIEKLARHFDQATSKDIKRLRRQVRLLSVCLEFFAPVLRVREVRQYKKIVSTMRPLLQQWHRLHLAAHRLQSDRTPVGQAPESDRASIQFAAGWLAGRLQGLRAGLGVVMERIARRQG